MSYVKFIDLCVCGLDGVLCVHVSTAAECCRVLFPPPLRVFMVAWFTRTGSDRDHR